MGKNAKRVVVTGGAGQIAYSLLFRLAAGDLFGPDQPIELSIRDLEVMKPVLQGVAMELEDCAFPLLRKIEVGSDPYQLFKDVDCAFLVGAKPRGPGMERKDLLFDNGKIFVEEGKALNEVASSDAKVLVVGNPCNTNCLIAMNHAPRLNRKNFHAMMRLDENRAKAQLAAKAGSLVQDITEMTIWGNHSATQVPDFTNAKIKGKKVSEVIKDKAWLYEDFIGTVQKRGAAIIAARGKSSAASAANAAVDAMRALFISQNDSFTSAICSDRNCYGIEENLIFGFPCKSRGNTDYEVVNGLPWDYFIKEKIAITQKELLEERELIRELLNE